MDIPAPGMQRKYSPFVSLWFPEVRSIDIEARPWETKWGFNDFVRSIFHVIAVILNDLRIPPENKIEKGTIMSSNFFCFYWPGKSNLKQLPE